jgi:solute carrier family 35, member E1
MQSAAAIGLVRPCAARSLGVRPRPRGLGLSVAAALPRAAGLTAAGRRVGLVPASPLEDKRPVVAAAAADGAAGGEEGSGGLVKTLQLGALFGLWYLFNIYFNIYNKQVSSQCSAHPRADTPSQRVAFRRISSVITARSVVIRSDRLANHRADQ